MKTAVNVFAFMACKNSPWVNCEKGTGYTKQVSHKQNWEKEKMTKEKI